MDPKPKTLVVELVGGPADGHQVVRPEVTTIAIEVPTVRGFAIYRRVPETGRFVYSMWRST